MAHGLLGRCLTGCGTAPELMAEASRALDATARCTAFASSRCTRPSAPTRVVRHGHAVSHAARAAFLRADAVLVADDEDAAFAELAGELDLRARRPASCSAARRLGRCPARDDATAGRSAAPSRSHARRRMRVTVVAATSAGRRSIDAASGYHDGVRVELLDREPPPAAPPSSPSAFDVVVATPRSAGCSPASSAPRRSRRAWPRPASSRSTALPCSCRSTASPRSRGPRRREPERRCCSPPRWCSPTGSGSGRGRHARRRAADALAAASRRPTGSGAASPRRRGSSRTPCSPASRTTTRTPSSTAGCSRDEPAMTGADAILRCLEAEGVEVVFGLPGGAILPLYDAMARGTRVRHVLARHEQGAGHMAQGYARASGRVGVAIATSGPGRDEPRHADRRRVDGLDAARLHHRPGALEPDRHGRVPGVRHHRHHDADRQALVARAGRRRASRT